MKGLTRFYVTSHRGVGTHSSDFLSDAPPLPPPPHKGKGKSREARTQTLALLSDSWCGLHPIPPLSYCEHGTSTSWRMRTAFQKVIALKFDSNIHCK